MCLLVKHALCSKQVQTAMGWFSADDLLKQVENAIDIFEVKTNNFATGLFMFDNAPSHQKQAPDALTARKMPKHPHATQTSMKGGPKM